MPFDDAAQPSGRSERTRRETSEPDGLRSMLSKVLLILVLGGAAVAVLRFREARAPAPPAPVQVAVGVPPPVAPVETVAPVSDGTPTASFEFHRKAPAYEQAFYVLGVVTNTSYVPIGKPELVIVFEDAQGNEVGTDHGYALADVLEPGERSYLSAIVTTPPAHENMRFEMVARAVGTRVPQARGLTVEASKPRVDGPIVHFWGKVKNHGNQPSSFTQVQVINLDAQDKLLSITSGFVNQDVLAPGESARFDISNVENPETARTLYQATGSVY